MTTAEFDDSAPIDVEAVSQELENTHTRINELMSQRDLLSTQIEDVKRLFQKLDSEKKQITTSLEQARWDARKLEKEKANAERRRLAQEEKARLEEEFAKVTRELDELTANCFWRGNNEKGLKAFPHQIEGGKKLAIAKRGILADKRGLGKTLGGIVWLDYLQAKKVLLVAPNDVVEQFVEEIQVWAPGRQIFNLAGLTPQQRTLIYGVLPMTKEVICTINYEAWRRDKSIIDDLVNIGFDSVLLDEAHRIKSSDKITARGVFQVVFSKNRCEDCGEIHCNRSWMIGGELKDFEPNKPVACSNCLSENTVPTVENVLSMTGTPLLNKPQEVFSLLYLIDPDRFPSENDFIYDFCEKSWETNRLQFRKGGLDRLVKHMDHFFVQRDRNSIGITVPPPAIFKHEIIKDRMTHSKQWKAYDDIVQAAAMVLQNGEKYSLFNLLDMLTRMRQVVTWPAGVVFRDPETKEILCQFDVEESQKVDAVEELVAELCEEGERTIVFSKFKAPLAELQRRFEKKRGVDFKKTTLATGDQTDWHRKQVRQDFDLKTAPANPRWNVAFATYDAFGTGVNLNGARHVVLLDREWSGGKEDQAIGRIDRINSVDQANVHIFEVKDTVDIFMSELIEHKRKMVDGFETTLTAAELLKGIMG